MREKVEPWINFLLLRAEAACFFSFKFNRWQRDVKQFVEVKNVSAWKSKIVDA